MKLINKSEDANNHSKKIYKLTEKGIDLMPMLLEMIVWGAKYDNETEAPAEFISRVKADKDKLIGELLVKIG